MAFQARNTATMSWSEAHRLQDWREVPLAVFDAQREYRYVLRRNWTSDNDRCVLWVMLNPSTADENALDPTLRRCATYSADWGYAGILVCNVFALRSTNPGGLYKVEDPVGASNTSWLSVAARLSSLVVLGWGAQPIVRKRLHYELSPGALTERVLRDHHKPPEGSSHLWCLGKTKRGFPKHPLYLPKSLTPVIFP